MGARRSVLAAARAVRSAPRVRLSAVAGAGGCSAASVQQALLAGRAQPGRCGAAAAVLASCEDTAIRASAAASSARWAAVAAVLADDPSPAVRFASGAAQARAAMPHDDDNDEVAIALEGNSSDPRSLARLSGRFGSNGCSLLAVDSPAKPDAVSLRLANSRSETIRLHAAVAARSRAALAAASADPKKRVRVAALANRFCPPRAIAAVAGGQHHEAAAAACNPACPPAAATTLARSASVQVRLTLASNLGCPPEAFEILCAPFDADGVDRHSRIRAAAAANPICPPHLARRLANSEDPSLRAAVASNPECSDDLVDALSRDDSTEVRAAVASSEACSSEIALRLAADPESEVRRHAVGNPVYPPGAAKGAFKIFSDWNALDSPNCPPERIEAAAWGLGSTRKAAKHPAAPPHLLARIASDPSCSLADRAAAVANARCPRAVVAVAALHAEAEIRTAALGHLVARSPHLRGAQPATALAAT